MIPWLFALLASAALAQPSPAASGRYIARSWGTADGLPQNTVTSIVQTRDGYLWLGTFGGLVRFDGHAFTVFNPENTPGLASARITTLLVDRSGVLWVGTEGGLTKYESGRFTTYTTREGVPYREIGSMFEDSRGRLWIGTGLGMARFDGRTFSPFAVGSGGPTIGRALAETRDGSVWIAILGGVARVPATGDPVVFPGDDTHQTFRVLVDATGRLWTGGSRLRRWEPSSSSGQDGRFVDVPIPNFPAADEGITALAEDREGGIWVGTTKHGVYRWRDGAVAAFTGADGLTNDFVRSVFVDRDANVWVGTDVGGLNRLKRRRVFSYQRPGSVEQSIAPIVGDGADGLWVGATCGGLLHFRTGALDVFRSAPETGTDCIWALLRDPDGTLWIGSMGGGLLRASGGRFTRFLRNDGTPSDLISALARDRDGTLWVGSDAGMSRFENGRFTDVGRDEGLTQRVLCITQDRAGALWVGTVAGLYRYAGGRFTRYGRADGLSHDLVRAVHEDADGVLWIGTYGGGLNRFKDGRFTTTYGVKEGLPDAAVSRIIEDPRGNLWMSGNKGVFRVARRMLNDFAEGRIAYITAVSYGTADAMTIDETNGGSPAGWRTADGRLWFPTIKGLVSIEPEAAPASPPPVFVERVLADGRPIGPDEWSGAGRGTADIEFRYTAIDLAAAEKTRFKYRLGGYDRDWIDAGDRRVAYYTKVPPGAFDFEVMATDSEGVWSTTPARVAVTVIPFWWQRREATVAGLLLLVALTGFSVRHVSLRRARARVAELERERALERERTRIARDLHDDLGSRLAQIALIAENPAHASPNRVSTVAREAMRTMDELVWTMNARNDTVERFAEYAAEFAEEHLTLAGIRYRLQMQPDLAGGRLDADTRRHLYLAFKEAVHNIVKHARASEVRIGVGVERGMLELEVADNGCGLPPGQRDGTGNGLRNMRERMDAAGGTLTVESAPDAGTRLVFRAPIGAAPAGT